MRRGGDFLRIATLAVAVSSAAAIAAAEAQAIDPVTGIETRTYLFSFTDEPVEDVADIVLGQTLTYPYRLEGVVGRVSFEVEGPMTEAQMIDAFDTALARSGIALAEEGGMLILRPMGATPSAPLAGSEAVAPSAAARPVYGEDRWQARARRWAPPFALGAVLGMGLGAAGVTWARARRRKISLGETPMPALPAPEFTPLDELPPMPLRDAIRGDPEHSRE